MLSLLMVFCAAMFYRFEVLSCACFKSCSVSNCPWNTLSSVTLTSKLSFEKSYYWNIFPNMLVASSLPPSLPLFWVAVAALWNRESVAEKQTL